MRFNLSFFYPVFLAGIVFAAFAPAADKPAPVTAPVPADVLDRIDKLELLVQSQGLLDMLQELDALRSEVNQLRGQIEVQNNTIKQLKNRQREIYTDVDRRIERIEAGNTVTPGKSESSTPPLKVMPPTEPDITISDKETGPALTIEQVETEPADTRPDEVETTAMVPSTIQSAPVHTDPAEIQAEYQQAFKLLKKSQYDQAIKAFEQFISNYPDSQYADNAQYWLAEAYYVTRRYEAAITEYNKLVSQYPDSQKLTQGLLKIGYSHQELGQLEEAKQTLNDLKEYYPGTTAARLAEDRLRQINAAE